jgi:hypothetical protein
MTISNKQRRAGSKERIQCDVSRSIEGSNGGKGSATDRSLRLAATRKREILLFQDRHARYRYSLHSHKEKDFHMHKRETKKRNFQY